MNEFSKINSNNNDMEEKNISNSNNEILTDKITTTSSIATISTDTVNNNNNNNKNYDNNYDNHSNTEPIRRRSTRVRHSRIPEERMKKFLEITGNIESKNISKSEPNILDQLYEQELLSLNKDDSMVNDVLNDDNKKVIEKSNFENVTNINQKTEFTNNTDTENHKHDKHPKKERKHDQKNMTDFISVKNENKEQPQKRRSTRKRHNVIPENTLRGYLEITGEFGEKFNQQQSQILEEFDEQSSLSTFISENNHIEYEINNISITNNNNVTTTTATTTTTNTNTNINTNININTNTNSNINTNANSNINSNINNNINTNINSNTNTNSNNADNDKNNKIGNNNIRNNNDTNANNENHNKGLISGNLKDNLSKRVEELSQIFEENKNVDEKFSKENHKAQQKLKRESDNDNKSELPRRHSKRVRHSYISDSTMKEYLEITSQLNVKHHQRGRHKKHSNNKSNNNNTVDSEYEKEKIKTRQKREKKN